MRRHWFLYATAILSWAVMLSGFTTSLRTDLPSNDDDPTETPTFIRATRSAYQERLDVDHYFTASAASTYDATDTGKHRYVTFQGPNTIASVNANEGSLFIKDVSAIAELHWRDESENEKQLTTLGALNLASSELLGVLANNTYFSAVDAAGTGTVNLIKANASDLAVLPGGSELATSDAPTEDAGIANKKYVDDITLVNTPWTGGESTTWPNGMIFKQGVTASIGSNATLEVNYASSFNTFVAAWVIPKAESAASDFSMGCSPKTGNEEDTLVIGNYFAAAAAYWFAIWY